MAVLSTGALTLADWAKRLDPNGNIPAIAELLSQTNEILEDAVFMEGNLPTGHRVSVRTGLPNVYWRALNAGVPTSKSTTAQVDEQVGMLEARSHNLNIPRYVDTFEEEAEIDLMAVRAERIALKAELAALEEKMDGYLKELGYAS